MVDLAKPSVAGVARDGFVEQLGSLGSTFVGPRLLRVGSGAGGCCRLVVIGHPCGAAALIVPVIVVIHRDGFYHPFSAVVSRQDYRVDGSTIISYTVDQQLQMTQSWIRSKSVLLGKIV